MSKKIKANPAGILQIAKKLGISTATVSRALREETSHLVKAGRRREIIELADSMLFRPNPGARFIRKGYNPTIGVVIPCHDDLFFSEFYGLFLSGILQAVDESDWEIKITLLSSKPEIPFIDKLRHIGMNCTGLIFCGKSLTMNQLEELHKYKRPLVILKSSLPPQVPVSEVNCHVVGLDNMEAAATAARFAIQLGHHRIGLVLGPQTSRDFQERYEGFNRYFTGQGISLPDEYVYFGFHDQHAGREAAKKLLTLPNPPTALLCSSDAQAFGVLDYAKEINIKCPEQLSVTGFDDGPWAMCSSPKLTTMKQPLREMAEKAVTLLQQSVSGQNHRNSMDFQASLIIRESTTPC
jgi:DNA-binding LacI/PurR family transcriptional regulator